MHIDISFLSVLHAFAYIYQILLSLSKVLSKLIIFQKLKLANVCAFL